MEQQEDFHEDGLDFELGEEDREEDLSMSTDPMTWARANKLQEAIQALLWRVLPKEERSMNKLGFNGENKLVNLIQDQYN